MTSHFDDPTANPDPANLGIGERTWPLGKPEPLGGMPDFNRLGILTAAAYQLLARARHLSNGAEADRSLSVILAQTACDLHTEQSIVTLLQKRAGQFNKVAATLLGAPVSLTDFRVQRVYSALTDDHPWGDDSLQRAPAVWWGRWVACQEWRSDIVAAARVITANEAELCVKVSVSCLAHLTDVIATIASDAGYKNIGDAASTANVG